MARDNKMLNIPASSPIHGYQSLNTPVSNRYEPLENHTILF
jgi:hypothetical protein